MATYGETVKGKRGSATRDHAVEKGKQEAWRQGTKSGGEERAMLWPRRTVQGHMKLWIICIDLLKNEYEVSKIKKRCNCCEHQAKGDLDQGKCINVLGLT